MVLMTKNRRLLGLVRRAYARAQVEDDQVLLVWNARVYLNDSLVIMESACPIFLEKVVEQLRTFAGERAAAAGELVWVRRYPNRTRRWMGHLRAAIPRAGTPEVAGRAP